MMVDCLRVLRCCICSGALGAPSARQDESSSSSNDGSGSSSDSESTKRQISVKDAKKAERVKAKERVDKVKSNLKKAREAAAEAKKETKKLKQNLKTSHREIKTLKSSAARFRKHRHNNPNDELTNMYNQARKLKNPRIRDAEMTKLLAKYEEEPACRFRLSK